MEKTNINLYIVKTFKNGYAIITDCGRIIESGLITYEDALREIEHELIGNTTPS